MKKYICALAILFGINNFSFGSQSRVSIKDAHRSGAALSKVQHLHAQRSKLLKQLKKEIAVFNGEIDRLYGLEAFIQEQQLKLKNHQSMLQPDQITEMCNRANRQAELLSRKRAKLHGRCLTLGACQCKSA